MDFVPCLTWIKQGVAKKIPEKVTISKEELKKIIDDNQEELRNLEADELSEDENNDENNTNEQEDNNDAGANRARGVEDEYDMDNYDNEDESSVQPLAGLAGLTLYADNDEDPYMTIKEDSDDEDFEIRSDDNLIVMGHVDGDCCGLEVFVYNEKENYNYVHHDIMLSSVPLCVEWLNFDPSEETPVNFVAVGSMNPVIEIWDLDIVDSLEPVYKLGKLKSKKKKRIKTDESTGHSDAVLDLSWNKILRNVLSSASADHTVALWDLAEGSAMNTITQFDDKVQTLEWHPIEAQTLLAGSYDKTAKLFDCRNTDPTNKIWTLDGEVERVVWDFHNPFYFYASTDKGFVYAVDIRTSEPVWTISAHSKACTGLSVSQNTPGLLITASTDSSVKVWDISEKPVFVVEKGTNMGSLYCLQSSPEYPLTVCCGGDDRNHNFDVLRLGDMNSVSTRFSERTMYSPEIESSSSNNNPSTSSSNVGLTSSLIKRKQPKHLKLKPKHKK